MQHKSGTALIWHEKVYVAPAMLRNMPENA